MQLSPCFNESLLSSGQRACNQFYWIKAVNAYMLMIVGVKMRDVVGCFGLRIHAYDDAEEAR